MYNVMLVLSVQHGDSVIIYIHSFSDSFLI